MPFSTYSLWMYRVIVAPDHTQRHSDTRQDSSGRVISPSPRPLPDNTQQTAIHGPGGIRTHNHSKRAAAVLRLRPRDHHHRPRSSDIIYQSSEDEASMRWQIREGRGIYVRLPFDTLLLTPFANSPNSRYYNIKFQDCMCNKM